MKDWKQFWQNYRVVEINSKNDLLFQVGKTVEGTIISDKQFKLDVEEIKINLNLQSNDILLDLCCGNGLLSFELSNNVKYVIGLDFSKVYIENARKFCSNEKTDFFDINILDSVQLKNILSKYKITKVLMNDCLAYFNPKSIDTIIKLLAEYDVEILITSILDKNKIWSFYDSLNRKLEYLIDVWFLKQKSGLGYWWQKSQIEKLAKENGFHPVFFNHHKINHTAHYRFNVKLKKSN